MPALRLLPVVKKCKTQRLDQGSIQLTGVDFDGDFDTLKTTIWDIAKPHLKGLARIVDGSASLDDEEPSIDKISDFVVINKSNRSYTFGEVIAPLHSISADLSNLSQRNGAAVTLTTNIYVWSRYLNKVGDYELVVAASAPGSGPAGQDRSGAPNQARFNEVVERLREIHNHLRGEDMVWSDWAGTLLRDPETLEHRILQPPPPEITLLFERQFRSEQQLIHIQHSMQIALDVIKDQVQAVRGLKRNLAYSVTDINNQLDQQERNLKAHKRAISSLLRAVRPVETSAAAEEFQNLQNEIDSNHSDGSVVEERRNRTRRQELTMNHAADAEEDGSASEDEDEDWSSAVGDAMGE
ncbi:UNVERIFIED_CONTAM: hypothetical protein HDU68_011306 [Siphonaria sp. JEL0065]|nr:hypothetical protein HDU68_011306 [Siphonaria sp. JEL0065]